MSSFTIENKPAVVKVVVEDKTILIQTVAIGGGGTGVITYATEAALLAATQTDGVIAYATDTEDHWLRQGGAWVKLSTAATDAAGWVYIGGLTVPGGTVSSQVYADAPGNTVLQSATVSALPITVQVRASYPTVKVNGVTAVLARDVSGGFYAGSVAITLSGTGPVQAVGVQPDGQDGAIDTCTVTVDLPPQLLTLAFTGPYPGSQTELKAGDSFQITGTTDKPINGVDILDFGACAANLIAVVTGTSFTVTGTIADRGITTQALPARVRARDAVTAAFGPTRDTNQGGGSTNGVHLVNLNNLYPTASWGTPTYPGGQQALKNVESATAPLTTANLDTLLVDSPNGDLSITAPTLIEAVKTVTRLAGSYNVTVNNLRATAIRTANAAQTVAQRVVNIAHVAASITVTEPAARLRSGGNNGTVAQNHTITLTSDQQLLAAPSLSPDLGGARGTFIGAGFVGGPSVWTRQLQVNDTDEKGTFNWSGLSSTNLAGIPTVTITGGTTYVLGGFVARTLTFGAFATVATMTVAVSDFTKLTAGIFTATNQPALKQAIGTPPSVTNGYTINSTGVNPTSLIWLDTAAAGANSSGTAQITNVEETV